MDSPSRALATVAEDGEEAQGPTSTASPTSSSADAYSARHARQHSRIHERNLSAFFPRPGQQGAGYGGTYEDPHAAGTFVPGVSDIPSVPASRAPGAGSSAAETPPRAQGARRGHHHRHSVSHNLFPFVDPATPPAPVSSLSPSKASSGNVDVQLPSATASFRRRYGHHGLLTRLLAYAVFHLPPATKLLLLLATLQAAFGAALWVQGQAAESLATTGLGYLVVFDGLGGVLSILLEHRAGGQSLWDVIRSSKDASVRQPFGCLRLITLSHFSQAVYLLFSAVYVCKESVEHVLLLHDPQDFDGSHGSGHGSVGHGEGRASTSDPHVSGVAFPSLALVAACLSCAVLAVAAHNHRGLSASLSPSSPLSNRSTRAAMPLVARLCNPFSTTVLVFGGSLLVVSGVLPAAQLAPVDKVLALLESLAMFYVASPAATSTGQALLQTSPAPQSRDRRVLDSAIAEIESLPAVESVGPLHVWQLGTPSTSAVSSASPAAAAELVEVKRATVATVVVKVRGAASDLDLLSVTQRAQERLASALSSAGRGGRDVDLDVTVAVERG
ncbi:hypothetical protein JCM10207_005405 [Rhodosporidiobolus poonsookiae]